MQGEIKTNSVELLNICVLNFVKETCIFIYIVFWYWNIRALIQYKEVILPVEEINL